MGRGKRMTPGKNPARPVKPSVLIRGPVLAFFTRSQKPRLLGIRRVVKKPREFNGTFQNGEKVLQLHLEYVTTGQQAHSVFREFVSRIPRLQEQGFVGVYGDTNNPALRKLLLRNGAVESPVPLPVAGKIEMLTERAAVQGFFPLKYVRSPAKRVMLRFNDFARTQKGREQR